MFKQKIILDGHVSEIYEIVPYDGELHIKYFKFEGVNYKLKHEIKKVDNLSNSTITYEDSTKRELLQTRINHHYKRGGN